MHGNLEALAQLAQHVLLGNAAVREDQLVCRGSADTHLLLLGAEGETGSSLLHDEGGDFLDLPAPLLDGAGHCENDIYVSFLAVGDEDLGAVDDIVVPVCHSLGLLALSVSTCSGFGEAECAQLFALSKGNQVFLLLLFRTESHNGIAAQGSVRGNDDACGAADLGKLFHAHNVGQRIAALSAVLLGNRDAQETVLRHLAGGLPGKFFGFIHLLSEGLYFFFGKLSEQRTCHFMLFAQRKIHGLHSSIYFLNFSSSLTSFCFSGSAPISSNLSCCQPFCSEQLFRPSLLTNASVFANLGSTPAVRRIRQNPVLAPSPDMRIIPVWGNRCTHNGRNRRSLDEAAIPPDICLTSCCSRRSLRRSSCPACLRGPSCAEADEDDTWNRRSRSAALP